jgi:hypothetical protein
VETGLEKLLFTIAIDCQVLLLLSYPSRSAKMDDKKSSEPDVFTSADRICQLSEIDKVLPLSAIGDIENC